MRAPGPHRGPVHDRPSVSLFFNSRTRNWSDDVTGFFHHSADLGTVDPNTRRKSNRCRARCTVVYLHGNGTDIGGVAEEAKALSRDLECHVVVPEYPGYGLAEGSSNEDSVDAVSLFM